MLRLRVSIMPIFIVLSFDGFRDSMPRSRMSFPGRRVTNRCRSLQRTATTDSAVRPLLFSMKRKISVLSAPGSSVSTASLQSCWHSEICGASTHVSARSEAAVARSYDCRRSAKPPANVRGITNCLSLVSVATLRPLEAFSTCSKRVTNSRNAARPTIGRRGIAW